MSLLAAAGCKKRKRGEKVFKFNNFGEKGYPADFIDDGCSFGENVKALLEYGQAEAGLCGGMSCWSFQLEVHRHPPLHVLLFVAEESIETSVHRHCCHCQYIGWGHHMICNKKYHFLVPSKEAVAAYLSYEESCCLDNEAEEEDSSNGGKYFNLVELRGHSLHGVFHSNGFGHLLCINGVEMGSDLAGHQVMDFWDRLCTGLGARKVSLKDYSQKRSMELRLLHGVAYKESWFGRWGYKFGRGAFGVTQEMYEKAMEAIRNMPLYLLIHQHHNHPNNNSIHHQISNIFLRYQTLSGNSLITLGGLFHFMLQLRSRLPKEDTISNSSGAGILVDMMTTTTTCRWSAKRVEMATRVIVEALKKRAECRRWISRQEVRDAARAYIGDTGLLDFVLKSLGNHIVGNYLVRRCLNPVTKVLEYCLEDVSNSAVLPKHQATYMANNDDDNNNNSKAQQYKITKAQVLKDMFYLYRNILNNLKQQTPIVMNMGILSTIPQASRVILDTKFLVKEFSEQAEQKKSGINNENSKFHCTIALLTDNNGLKKTTIMAPKESVAVRINATLDDLIVQVESKFKRIYWGLRNLVVKSVANHNNNNNVMVVSGSDLVVRQFNDGDQLVLEGTLNNNTNMNMNGDIAAETGLLLGIDNRENYNCEEGMTSLVVTNNCAVDCPCGAKEDDGERMVSCDICQVWQHTRCVGIPNNKEIPTIFLCSRCEHEVLLLPASLP